MNTPIIGILGDGQLAKYLIEASSKLNIKTYALGLCPDECIPNSNHVVGNIFDENDVINFAKKVDILTLENEFIPLNVLEKVKEKLLPSFESFKLIENKLAEKKLAKKINIPLAQYELITISDLCFENSAIYKLPKGGYDGKGNFLVKNENELADMLKKLDSIKESKILKEEVLDFEKEVSITLVRNNKSEFIIYPVVDTVQKNNVCEFVSIPSLITSEIKNKIEKYSKKLLNEIDYVGVMSIEFFIMRNGDIYYNECSPRPHNSAHYTLDACYTSQFENHIRAIAGLDLGLGDLKYPCAYMFNLLGTQKGRNRLENISNQDDKTTIYDYGKREERPGRKMGHVNLIGQDKVELNLIAKEYKEQLTQQGLTL